MARTISLFCFVALFLGSILLCHGRSVDATRTVEKRMLVGLQWCIAKQGLSQETLQKAIDYYCGDPGRTVDCTALQMGCKEPDTKFAHASYAINFFAFRNRICPKDVGQIIYDNPSYPGCIYSGYPKDGSSK